MTNWSSRWRHFARIADVDLSLSLPLRIGRHVTMPLMKSFYHRFPSAGLHVSREPEPEYSEGLPPVHSISAYSIFRRHPRVLRSTSSAGRRFTSSAAAATCLGTVMSSLWRRPDYRS